MALGGGGAAAAASKLGPAQPLSGEGTELLPALCPARSRGGAGVAALHAEASAVLCLASLLCLDARTGLQRQHRLGNPDVGGEAWAGDRAARGEALPACLLSQLSGCRLGSLGKERCSNVSLLQRRRLEKASLVRLGLWLQVLGNGVGCSTPMPAHCVP